MPSEALRRKIQLNREAKRVERISGKIFGVEIVQYLDDSDMPPWVGEALQACQHSVSVPAVRISDDADPDQVDDWCVNLLKSAGIDGRFYLGTGMEYFRWADCSVVGAGWMQSIRAEFGPDLSFVSPDQRSMVVIFEEEYEYLGFRCSSSEY